MISTTVVQADTWWELDPEQRGALRDWLRANQLEADDLPVGEPITIKGNVIHYTRIRRTPEGRPRARRCPFSGQWRIEAEAATAPLITPLPEAAASPDPT